MAMEGQNCFGCGKLLDSGEDKKRRRLLSNLSLATHLQTLCKFIAEQGPGTGSIEDGEVDISKLHTGYICRSCVVLVDKYQQLQKQLSNNLSGCYPKYPVRGKQVLKDK